MGHRPGSNEAVDEEYPTRPHLASRARQGTVPLVVPWALPLAAPRAVPLTAVRPILRVWSRLR